MDQEFRLNYKHSPEQLLSFLTYCPGYLFVWQIRKGFFTSRFSFCFDPSSGPNPMFVIS